MDNSFFALRDSCDKEVLKRRHGKILSCVGTKIREGKEIIRQTRPALFNSPKYVTSEKSN